MLRVLRGVAYHMPLVGYVQGFNFIAGALFKMFQSEQYAFWAFLSILEANDTINVYTDGMPRLKILLY